MINLNGTYPERVILYCHSQGNVIGHQALMARPTLTLSSVNPGDVVALQVQVTDTPDEATTTAFRNESAHDQPAAAHIQGRLVTGVNCGLYGHSK